MSPCWWPAAAKTASSAWRSWCRGAALPATGNTASTAPCSPRRRAPTTAAPGCSTATANWWASARWSSPTHAPASAAKARACRATCSCRPICCGRSWASCAASGMSSASRRAWLGVNCVEQGGTLHVVRVAGDSPAEAAGLRVGDRIVAIDGTAVTTLDTLWTRLWSGGPPERDVTLGDRARRHAPGRGPAQRRSRANHQAARRGLSHARPAAAQATAGVG